jgi:hypothetical protein
LIFDYSRDIDGKNARLALDYVQRLKLDDAAEYLIAKLQATKAPVDIEWAETYELIRKIKKNEICRKDFSKEAHVLSYKCKTHEMKCLIRITEVYNYYVLRKFECLSEISAGLEEAINEISNDYLRESFGIRYKVLMSWLAIYNDDIDTARKHANYLVHNDSGQNRIANALHTLGTTYIFDNADLALKHLGQAVELFRDEYQKGMAIKSYNFVCNLYEMEPKYNVSVDEVADREREVFRQIRSGDTEAAIQTLESVETTGMSDYDLAFHYYYLGLAKQCEQSFVTSVYHFKKTGDKFYRKLALCELQRLGYGEILLKTLNI